MRIGVLTGGGDCPGLNAVIRAVARRSWARGHEVVGVREGWRGMVEQLFEPLGPNEISGILPRGGTIIGTSRTNPYKVDGGIEAVQALVRGARRARRDRRRGHARRRLEALRRVRPPVVGVPKTIDNDLSGTDYTFGFDTAVAICTEAIDRLHTTAESHNRVMVVEVMGRHAGWIAVHSGIAGGADVILIPERPVDFDEVTREIRSAGTRSGKNFSIVVVSEGCELPGAEDKGEVDQFGHKLLAKRGVGDRSARRSRAAPASRRASPCSATCSAAARRPRTTGSSRRASASRRPTSSRQAQFGQMAALRGRRRDLGLAARRRPPS